MSEKKINDKDVLAIAEKILKTNELLFAKLALSERDERIKELNEEIAAIKADLQSEGEKLNKALQRLRSETK